MKMKVFLAKIENQMQIVEQKHKILKTLAAEYTMTFRRVGSRETGS